MSGAIVTPRACPGQDRWPRDNTHRPLGTLQGRWQVLGMGGCWGPPRGQNAGGGPGCLGVGPEGSDPASGAWLNEHATEPLHVPPPGPPQMSQGVEVSADTQALVEAGAAFCLGLGFSC